MCSIEKRGKLFILTLTGEDQHRLSLTLISHILQSLRQVKSQSEPGSVLITISEGKFFSNGFDTPWAQSISGGSEVKFLELLRHMMELFKSVAIELISLPMPTIAAINGHAAAAGMVLALCHDYAMMRSDKGVFYMPEVDLGLPIPDYFTALFGEKVSSFETRRDLFLAGKKLKGGDAKYAKFVGSVHDSEEKLIDEAMLLAQNLSKKNWKGENYMLIRMSLLPKSCEVLGVRSFELSKL